MAYTEMELGLALDEGRILISDVNDTIFVVRRSGPAIHRSRDWFIPCEYGSPDRRPRRFDLYPRLARNIRVVAA